MSMAEQMKELRLRKMGQNQTVEEKLKEKFGAAVDDPQMKAYLDTMKMFENRDFKEERTQMLAQAEKLSNNPHVSSLTKKGNYVLQQVRGCVDESMMQKMSTDPTKVQMTLLNDYLNSYTQKLARSNPEDPNKIKIDKQDFYQIVKDVNADSYNPYAQAEHLKNELNLIVQIGRSNSGANVMS